MDVNKYTVGWICALPLEMAAARNMLDEDRGRPSQRAATDNNNYRLGRIGDHDVVLTCLPSGVYGTTSATSVAVQMLTSFPSIRIGLLVGIGGGVSSDEVDIRLGDVVISKPGNRSGGVIQYDMGKTIAGEFVQTGQLNKPPQALLRAIASVEADHMLGENRICEILSDSAKKRRATQQAFYHTPGVENDTLFEADYTHPPKNMTCASCDMKRRVKRPTRETGDPQIHYGLIASANQVMKDGEMRDKLHKETGVICFEMEAAGLMDLFPCLVIRGICDYADSHKNKVWQKYAAMTAAACAKELLVDAIQSNLVGDSPAAEEVLGKQVPGEHMNGTVPSQLSGFRVHQEGPSFSGQNKVGSGRVNQIGNIALGNGNFTMN